MAVKKKKDAQGSMALTGHLKELRNRIFICLIPFVILSAVFLTVSDTLVSFLTDMGESYGYTYIYLSPQELLIEYFRISLLAAFLCCVPLILYQVWAFARPGLKKGENRMFGFAMVFGLLCFIVGVAFAYTITLPFMLNFLIGLSNTTISASISIKEYISFLLTIFVIFGTVFEMPLLSVVLTNLGLIKPETLKKVRKFAIVIIFVVGAIITPPDILSQIMVALPMILLYQISIWLSAVVYKLRKKKLDEEEAQEASEEDDDKDSDDKE